MLFEDKFLQSEGMNSRVLLNYWILCLVLLSIGSIVPLSAVFNVFLAIDAIMHLVLCVVIAFISMILFRRRKTALMLSFAVTPYGYLLEYIHAMFSGESFNVVNVLMNNLGVLLGLAGGFVLRLKYHYYREQNHGHERDPHVHNQ